MLYANEMAITVRPARPRLKETQHMDTLSRHSLQQSDARRDLEDGIGGHDDKPYEDTEYGGALGTTLWIGVSWRLLTVTQAMKNSSVVG